MSGRLDLSFTHQGGPDVGELAVVVEVVHASLEEAAPPRLVQLASGWRQDLEPGTYLVRVRFPSGKEIRRTCTVRDGEHIPISIDVRGLAGQESLERSVDLRPVVREQSAPALAGTSFAAAWVRRWRGEASREWQPVGFDGTTIGSDDYAVQYRFASTQQSNVLQLGAPRIAWRFVSLPAAPAVGVTVSPRGESDLAVEVTTDSAEAEALLGYLRTGAVEGADVTAESLLRQKRRDPIAAAIGGYYLLRTANLHRLSSWGPNLSRQFPWLPDGAVINGWQHIHAGRKHPGDPDRHFNEARQQLIQATRRGVPVYTEGLRLLVDGLRLLREDTEADDAELDAALTFIEPFAVAADWSAATVTYSGADPAEPHSRRRFGVPKDHEQLVPLRPQDWSGVMTALVAPPASNAAVRDLAEALDRARDLARNLADRDLDLAQDLDLAHDLDLAAARDRAHDLAAALDRARDLARNLASVPDLAEVLALVRDLAFDLDLTLDRARYLAEALALDLDRALDHARDLAQVLALALVRSRADARDLAKARDRARDLVRALDHARDLAKARDRARDLVRALDHARDLAGALLTTPSPLPP
jgi:hypothetical protein